MVCSSSNVSAMVLLIFGLKREGLWLSEKSTNAARCLSKKRKIGAVPVSLVSIAAESNRPL